MNMLKLAVDAAMTLLLLLSMAYETVGPAFGRLFEKISGMPTDGFALGSLMHECIGSALILLFFLHLWLNRSLLKNLFRGRLSAVRGVLALVNVLLTADAVLLLASGVMISKSLFAGLPVKGGMSFARTAHMLASYWGYVIMSFHVGLYLDVMKAEAGLAPVPAKHSALRRALSYAAAAVIMFFGARAFARRRIGDYMFLRSQFVFFDFEEPLSRFLLDYIAVMLLFVCLGHIFMLLLRRAGRRKGEHA
ncbi:MAG: DUF4405 domain-containing protein [Synergistes sp.]|nr:DUF4405 domain-containing protein [Synergistes sp.]